MKSISPPKKTIFSVDYSYQRVPTLAKFALSNARVRGVKGPFGCLPADAEVLTNVGWKFIKDITTLDFIAQYEPTTQEISFVNPIEVYKYPADKWITFKSAYSTYMKVSPYHRMPLYNFRKKFVVKKAIEVFKKPSKYSIPVHFKATNSIKEYDEALLRFLVAASADGGKSGNSICFTFRKQRKIDRLKYLLDKTGIEYRVRTYIRKEGAKEIIFCTKPPEFYKTFPKEWYGLSSKYLSIIVDECLFWDGGDYGKDRRYFTIIKENADFIQFAAHASGFKTYISSIDRKKDNWNVNYTVWIASSNTLPSIRKDWTQITMEEAKPNELKYSLKVPTSFYIARQNKHVFVTGNSGKSSACVMEIIRRGLAQRKNQQGIRKSRWAVVRQTYRQLADTTIKTFFEWFPPGMFGEYLASKNIYTIKALPDTEIEVLFRALDNPEDVKNLMSLELTGAWINEAKEVAVEVIDAIDGRICRYPANKHGGCSWCGIIMDTNPPDDESWWYNRFEVIKPKGWEGFSQPSGLSLEAENILTKKEEVILKKDPKADIVGGLSHDYYTNLKEGKGKDFIRVYIDGKYGLVKKGKPIFEHTYNEDVHLSKEEVYPILNSQLVVGFDFGLNPTAVFTQYSPKGRLLVLDELTSDGMGLDQFIKFVFQPFVNQKYRDYEMLIVGDPAGVQRAQSDERSCFDILREHKYKVIPARTNTLVDRLGAVEYFLTSMVEGLPRFILSKTCSTLPKGFVSGYHYRRLKVSGERYTDVPEKNAFSHGMDALQYACMFFAKKRNTKKFNIKRDTYKPAIAYAGY